jgi:hypothetical protein
LNKIGLKQDSTLELNDEISFPSIRYHVHPNLYSLDSFNAPISSSDKDVIEEAVLYQLFFNSKNFIMILKMFLKFSHHFFLTQKITYSINITSFRDISKAVNQFFSYKQLEDDLKRNFSNFDLMKLALYITYGLSLTDQISVLQHDSSHSKSKNHRENFHDLSPEIKEFLEDSESKSAFISFLEKTKESKFVFKKCFQHFEYSANSEFAFPKYDERVFIEGLHDVQLDMYEELGTQI